MRESENDGDDFSSSLAALGPCFAFFHRSTFEKLTGESAIGAGGRASGGGRRRAA